MTDFLFYLLSCSLVLALLAAAIAAVKKLLGRWLTASAHYYLWTVLFAAAIASLFPRPGLPLSLLSREGRLTSAAAAVQDAGTGSLQDFAVNVQGAVPHTLAAVCFFVWLSGMVFFLFRTFYGILESLRLPKSACPAKSLALQKTALDCSLLLGIKRPFPLFFSDRVQSPVTAGLLRPFILLPDETCKAAKYVLLHEMIHCKRRDPLLNLMMQLLLAVNWFNPAVWYGASQMKKDREISCDDAVLSLLNETEQKQYGYAVISWAADSCGSAVGIGSPAAGLKQRVSRIASYKKSDRAAKRLSAAILALALAGAFLLAPSADAASQSCKTELPGSVVSEDLSRYFGDFQGSFVLYDTVQNQYTVYNEDLARTRISPASTFKIYSGLLALETGTITAENSRLAWDGSPSSFEEWNRDQTLDTAMKNSVNWYFQTLDREAGIRKLRSFYRQISYGNCAVGGSADTYWMNGSLKISPVEQVMLLTGLCENRWNLKASSVSAIQKSIRLTSKLYGKTGTIMENGCTVSGWFIGYIKTASGLQVFALNLQGEDGASGSRAAETAEKILKGKNLL